MYSQFNNDWHRRDDIVRPLGDRRGNVHYIWIFDLDSGVLRLEQKGGHLWVPLDLVRQRPITIYDFKPFQVTQIDSLPWKPYKPGYKIRRRQINVQRRKALVNRILGDFAFQWRHILKNSHNNFTFRRLAQAIIKILTLDFAVEEAPYHSHFGGRLPMILICDIPEWDYTSQNLFRVGDTATITDQHFRFAAEHATADYGGRCLRNPALINTSFTYLLLSMKELVLTQRTERGRRYTVPVPFFDGTHIPSDEAIEILLHATQPPPSRPPLAKLPIEVQDMILKYVSPWPLERARIGCLLEAGSVFTWKCGNRDREDMSAFGCRSLATPVPVHIQFGHQFSGVAYS